jgi:molybdopterin synthase catalytic subunit
VFIGRVRNHHQGKKVQKLYYECYEPMAKKKMQSIVNQIKIQYPVYEMRILHRVGWIEIGEVAVVIEVRAAHRDEAFLACRSAIEQIKTYVPIWKEEHYGDGTYEWIYCAHETEATT